MQLVNEEETFTSFIPPFALFYKDMQLVNEEEK